MLETIIKVPIYKHPSMFLTRFLDLNLPLPTKTSKSCLVPVPDIFSVNNGGRGHAFLSNFNNHL